MAFIDKQELLLHTNGGLDIILKYYPDAEEVISKRATHFKARPEKTASARLTQAPDGNWLVTDFGSDQKTRNAIDIAMLEEKVAPTDTARYKEVLNMLAGEFGFASVKQKFIPHKPDTVFREAHSNEVAGIFPLETRPFTEADFRIIFADKVRTYKTFEELLEVCNTYRFKAITGYIHIKQDDTKGKLMARVVKATEFYPMYMWDEGKFQKLYFPKEFNKQYRFITAGEKPAHYLHGFNQIENAYKERIASVEEEVVSDELMEEEPKPKEKKIIKLKNVIICTGGTDAMNVAALTGIKEGIGYYVVWHNSESEKLSAYHYWQLVKYCQDICYLGDIDSTGLQKAHELCMQWLDIRKIELPSSLLNSKDSFRGGSLKDVRDFLKRHTAHDFHGLYERALPYRFWELYGEYKFNAKGGKKLEHRYEVKYKSLLNFLTNNGFYQYRDADTEDSILVYVKGNIVKKVSVKDIRLFIIEFVESRCTDPKLIDLMHRLHHFDYATLPYIELNFESITAEYRYLFFLDYAWKVSKDSIEYFDYEKQPADCFVWDTEIIPHKAGKPMDSFFTIQVQEGMRSIVFNNTSCLFLQFLMNTCRMHWRVEKLGISLEDGSKRNELTPAELEEEQHHLINRLFTTGYVAHGYRDSSKAWAVFALENKIMDDDESSGRSGKSLYSNAFVHIHPNMLSLDARNKKLVETPHFFESVNRKTKVLHIEDCYRGYDYSADYNKITGSWQINPKGKKIVTIPFKYAPIPIYSSNYPLRNLDSSTQARFLFTAFSDYYHWSNEEFETPWQPAHDFGKQLFENFTELEWQYYYNTMAQCIQFYLSCTERIDPPMNVINERNLKSLIPDEFMEWAEIYFVTEGGERLNTNVLKTEIVEDYKTNVGKEKYNKKTFDRYLRRWCKLKGFEYNPLVECTDKKNRYVKKWLEGKQVYYIHIKTPLVTYDENQQLESALP